MSSVTITSAPAKNAKVAGRRFQKQKEGLCGVIAVNNALGRKILEREDVDAIVKSIGEGGDEHGNYSSKALHLALQKKGHQLKRMKNKNHMWLAKQRVGKYLVMGWHLIYDMDHLHYIGVDCGEQLVIDGAKRSMKRLDVGGILACLKKGIYKIWEIQKSN